MGEFPVKLDEIGFWSEIKLDILKEYAKPYTTILKKWGLKAFYIDAFSGAGVHKSESSKELIPGSPINALSITPPFDGYFFIDLNPSKIRVLRQTVGARSDVEIYEGDCNDHLLNIFQKINRERRERALCLLDPYGLHLDWKVIETAGKNGAIEIFLNFPTYDMNLNVLWQDRSRVSNQQSARMDRFWGDDTWESAAYTTEDDFFGGMRKRDIEAIVKAFRSR